MRFKYSLDFESKKKQFRQNKNDQSKQFFLKFLMIALGFTSLISHSSTPSITQTQTQLKQLDVKMNTLKGHLATAHDKREVLNQELAVTEKQMGEGLHQLQELQELITQKEIHIAKLNKKVQESNHQLQIQQQLLASHVKARFQMGEYQPLKWLINQDDPHKMSQIITYYQYVIKSRQHLMAQIDSAQKTLYKDNKTLEQELSQKLHLKNQISQHQEQLEQNKKYHNNLIGQLNQDIQSNQNTLVEFQKNKDNLKNLLKTLAQQSFASPSKPFANMRKQLPRPVQTKNFKKMNQGVTFFANEGTAVTAVYPGKILFSDWLKGYGLLLILDHGQGFMTLYAHNQSLLKHKGDIVRQKEQIAVVGHSGGIKQNSLYFEIRLKGKAISPLDWLS